MLTSARIRCGAVITLAGLLVSPVLLGVSTTRPAVAVPPTSINRADRVAVINAFYDVWLANERVPLIWSGNAQTCLAGAVNPEAQQAMQDQVNYFRTMLGLDLVSFDPALNAVAQETAMLMAANGDVTHAPPNTWRCWTPVGAQGAAASSLDGGGAGARAITDYMLEEGPGNDQAGHRRWLIVPTVRTLGIGSTDTTHALTGGGASDPNATKPEWLPWPTDGYFPMPLEPQGRWSLSSSLSTDFSQAQVAMTGPGGVPISVTRNPVTRGMGVDSVVWQVGSLPKPTQGVDVPVTVTVSGMTRTTGQGATATVSALPPVTYTVTLVAPDRPLPNLTPPTLRPTLPVVGGTLTLSRQGSWQSDGFQLKGVRWLRNGVASGPESKQTSYTIKPRDAGAQLAAEVLAVDEEGIYAPGAATTLPTISVIDRPKLVAAGGGPVRVGGQVMVRRTWPREVKATVSWRLAGGARVLGTGDHYRPTAEVRGRTLTALVTLSAKHYSPVRVKSRTIRVR